MDDVICNAQLVISLLPGTLKTAVKLFWDILTVEAEEPYQK